MYPYKNHYLLANQMASLSLQENSVKPEISYYVQPYQHKGVTVMAVPPSHYQLLSLDHIKVDGIGRPLLKGAPIRVPNCPAVHSYLQQFSSAAGKAPACFPLNRMPKNSPEQSYTRDSRWKNDSCFLVQSRSASEHAKNKRCLSFSQICERTANLSMSQLEILNIPRKQNTETSLTKLIRPGTGRPPLQRHDFNPHPYDDAASRNVYLNTHGSFLQRQPCWKTSSSPPLAIIEKPDQQLAKKKKRRRRKRRNRNESGESFPENGQDAPRNQSSSQQLLNILTALSLDKLPHPPQQQRPKQKNADARALVPWRKDSSVKLSGLCGWIGQSQNTVRQNTIHHRQPWAPSPPKGPKRRVRRARHSRKLQVRGQGISPSPVTPGEA